MDHPAGSAKTVVTFAEALKLAIERHRGGDYPQAEAILRRLAQSKPDHELVRDVLIQALFNQGKAAEAVALYDDAVARGAYPCDPDFDALYRAALLATAYCPSPLARRAKHHTLLALLAPTLTLEGDVAECGCYRGLSSYLILNRLRMHEPGFAGRGYHIFDSFQGLSAPGPQDAVSSDHPNAEGLRYMRTPGAFAASIETVKDALSAFREVEFHPGWIPSPFARLPEKRYRFVHLDVDLHEPTRAALEYFHPRLAPNGVLVCDDYGWPGARLAIEEFCKPRGIAFAVTAHAQAVITRA